MPLKNPVFLVIVKSKSVIDVRCFQVFCLSLFIFVGASFLALDWGFETFFYALTGCLLGQICGARKMKISFLSPLITSLSLSILLKTSVPYIFVFAGFAACISKFLLRSGRSGHFFNPANFAIVLVLTLFPSLTWISLNSWGTSTFTVLFFTSLGILMLVWARSYAQPLGFISSYLILLFGRTFWLGDPFSIPFHHLSSGALWLFVFYMISDPKTAPWNKQAAFLQGFMIACLGHYFVFVEHHYTGIFYALFLGSLAKPILDKFFYGEKYQWKNLTVSP